MLVANCKLPSSLSQLCPSAAWWLEMAIMVNQEIFKVA